MTRTRIAATLITATAGLLSATRAAADVKLPEIISDNMVLQRSARCPVWGWADPGEQVTVSLPGVSATTTAGADGRWRVTLDTVAAAGAATAGSFAVDVRGNNALRVENVVLGEVWVCSGQSNMEWSVRMSKDAEKEMAAGDFPQIRHFAVAKKVATEPRQEAGGRWEVCTPQTVGNFTAVGYYFGRELHQTLNVPVGLVHTSWGGTPAEAWVSEPAMNADPDLKRMVDARKLAEKGAGPAREKWKADVAAWEKSALAQDAGNAGFAQGWADPDASTADWKTMPLPQGWEAAGLKMDGCVWFRRDVEVSAALAGKPLALELGAIDDFDVTYFNGTQVGAIGRETENYWSARRKYAVPAELVKSGRNVIAVRVFDHAGGGGLTGPAPSMRLSADGQSPISLAGEWRYKVEQELPERSVDVFARRPQEPFVNQNSASTLYNGMVHPLVPFAIRGAIWYQGESNVGRADQYRRLLPTLIADWRGRWEQGEFPFYIVQLASFLKRMPEPGESGWAHLREAQTFTAATVPNSGLAVAIDIGDADDIHPANKQDVGRRLALNALALTYGRPVEYSGPVYRSVTFGTGTARVEFAHADGLKTADGGPVRGFAVAGSDGKFVWAEATIDGTAVTLRAPEVPKPRTVRYAWADNPDCNLTNAAGLPAVPFRSDGPIP
ncbi:MAG TPA: sialate O-acetylesterase [Tepidisphaeraceae bacterium]|nr:sialate O-acetylesterase [Tepidisphaeraceae bacterium]